jgi:cell division protein FtsA
MNSSKITNFFYLGSSRLALARVDFSNLSRPRVLYFKTEAAKNFAVGRTRDIENISAQVKRLFEDAELDNFPEITLILSHPLVRGYNFSSSIFYAAPHTIEPEDVEEVIRQTRSVAMVPIRERIIQSVAQEFWVNDARGIHNPTDLEAERLGVSLRLLAIEAEDYRNIVKIFDRSEAEIETVLPKAYAASFAALEESEKRNGVLLLDAGGHSLDTVYFKDGMFSDSASLPWGGEILNQEMARRSHLGAGAIRRLKEEFGTFLEGAADEEMLPLEEGGEERGALRRGELRAHLEAGLATLWPRLDPVIERIRKDCGPQIGRAHV